MVGSREAELGVSEDMKRIGIWAFLSVLAGCGSEPAPSTAPLGSGGTAAGTLASPVAGTTATAGSTAGATGFAGTPGAAGRGAAGTGAPAGMAGRGASGTGAAGTPAAGSGGGAAGSAAGRGSAGAAGGGGAAGRGGAGGNSGGSPAAGSGGAAGSGMVPTEKFSFFVTSLAGMQELSKSDKGFGGNLTFGEASGLAGADKICTTLAEKSMPGAGAKQWRAFLSTSKGGQNGGPVHARDRIGQGPWYDRTGRLVASSLSALLMNRPMDAEAAIKNDLPNENGVPNRTDAMPGMDDNHDTVTGSNAQGMYDNGNTCGDWTSTEVVMGQRGPTVGHSWPSEQSGVSWIRAHNAPGCAASVMLTQTGAGSGQGIGNSGGYGGIYCFALQP